MTSYFLSKHVYFCVRGGELVFLDLKADKYFSMAAAKARSFVPELASNSRRQELQSTGSLNGSATAPEDLSPQPTNGAAALATLLKRGLLTTDSSEGKAVAATHIDPPSVDLIGSLPEVETRLYWSDVLKFLRAVISAWLILKLRPLEDVVRRVRRRREAQGPTVSLDLAAARRCVGLFERMRPFVFSAHNACLFDSLVLSEFLALYRLYPEWVFGVQTAPFAAHCWLQHSHIAFNDTAEHASEFTPIMSI
jgi:Transglutaminase-like superfamily